MKTKIKICGITNIEDALYAIDCGADAIGLVFYAKSPRYISLAHAKVIIQQLPPFVSVFGLCVNADPNFVKQVIRTGVNILQFHGDESPSFCQQFGFPYVKAVRVEKKDDIENAANEYNESRALLLDSKSKHVYGGSGQMFDWSIIPQDLAKKVIVAGGLTPLNVTNLLEKVSPMGVDVSSGVELQKAVKSKQKIKDFCHAVRKFNCRLTGAHPSNCVNFS
ncbi:phosphoribosylanthranilate isomerase [Facilibium subflavum]|uniref:phosphoribosylanthranilate isomerase n=1 Tax=Facilibium subflavum TaxID=2219058 RepID=UPI000E65D3BB|nr:phosphoribosylanthranilate isomerase [Facilibium subflavum]